MKKYKKMVNNCIAEYNKKPDLLVRQEIVTRVIDSAGLFYTKGFNHNGNNVFKLIGDTSYIIINREIKEWMKLAALFHEYGHYLCSQNRCSCGVYRQDFTFKSRVMQEYHAMWYAYKRLVDENLWEVLRLDIKWMAGLFKGVPFQSENMKVYYLARRMLKRTKVWRQISERINQNSIL